jgi:endonuclease III
LNRFSMMMARLKRHYGEPDSPPANGPFELILWENACYLLPDERRREVFESLRTRVGLTPEALFSASTDVLLPLAQRGGMRPDTRVARWREIAGITLRRYDGNLTRILALPYPAARNALKQFPTIGDPGAEKILLFCGVSQGLPLESNGLRVLVRYGWGRSQKNYGATYRSVQEALRLELPTAADHLKRAHLLLRIHGKSVCKDTAPLCHLCPVAVECSFPSANASQLSKSAQHTRGPHR